MVLGVLSGGATCTNSTGRYDVAPICHPLKVAARVRIPYGLPTKHQVRPPKTGAGTW